MPARRLVFLAAALSLAACGGPSRDRVAADMAALAAIGARPGDVEVVVVSSKQGRGDVDSLNQHVGFDLVARRDVTLAGPVTGGETVRLAAGQRLAGGKAVLLYEKPESGPWQVTGMELEQPPFPAAR